MPGCAGNLGYSKITTSRPSSPTAGGPFPGILPLLVILGSRIASTKGGLRSGVTHVTVCANDGRASAAAAGRMLFRKRASNASRMILPSHHPHLQTIVREMPGPVPASTHVAALDRCTFQGLTTGRVSVSVSGITAPAGRDLPEPSLSMLAHWTTPGWPWRCPRYRTRRRARAPATGAALLAIRPS